VNITTLERFLLRV